MERGFYNDDFEDLIKQKADQYKMYPSDQVWKGINRSLHTRRKWYWLSFVLFLSGLTYYAIVQLLSPSSGNKKPVANVNPASQLTIADDNTHDKPAAVVVPFSTQIKQKDPRSGPATASRSYVMNPAIDDEVGSIVPTVVTARGLSPITEATREEVIAEETTGRQGKGSQTNTLLADKLTAANSHNNKNSTSIEYKPLIFVTEQYPAAPPEEEQQVVTPAKEAETDPEKQDEERINWLQQYAVYNLSVPKMKRLSWQLSFAPTMNYRKLQGSGATMPSDIKNVPMAQNVADDPNQLVNHKPALGFEMGSHFLYALNKDVQIRAGVQFNYSRYAIQAYGSYSADIATIALNSSTRHVDSVTNLTRIRNFGGDISENLQNQYFQLSVPVGIQMRLIGNGKLQVGAAGTIQPTFMANRQTYLITTDYKNYTKEPSLVRRWNLNTGAELFLSYKSGDLKWQVGPQFRYQLLSSYVKEYPIREFLMEYGIKIGVTKTIR